MDLSSFANLLGDPRPNTPACEVDTRPMWLPWPTRPVDTPRKAGRRPMSAVTRRGTSPSRKQQTRCLHLMASEHRTPGDVELGQHLGAQPLEPVPKELASSMEREFAAALGIG